MVRRWANRGDCGDRESACGVPGVSTIMRGMGEIEQRWEGLCARLGRGDRAAALWTILEALYIHPARFYHAIDHARDCVNKLAAEPGAMRRDECELALWLHDCVYVPGAHDNEQRSGEIARVFCGELGISEDAASRVRELIMATLHAGKPLTGDAALVADVDLSSIGSDPATFARGSEMIRREFADFPEDAYRHGRIAFLTSMLARSRIFHTDSFHQRFDAPARRNLQTELEALGHGD